MKEKKMTFRREELEKLSTLELDDILRAELNSDAPDRETVLLVLSILEDRDPTNAANRPEGAEEAWEGFLKRAGHSETPVHKPNKKPRKWLGAVAAVAAIVLVLLITVPQTVGAENIFEIIGRWTRDIFNLSDGTERHLRSEYVFQTDHEGLQQLYDAVVAQGVTDPVVPTWIPDGYELKELKVLYQPSTPKVYAFFAVGDEYIQITVEIYSSEEANEYAKDDINVKEIEYDGVCYYLMPNDDTYKAIWNAGKVECSVITNNSYEVLKKILGSI